MPIITGLSDNGCGKPGAAGEAAQPTDACSLTHGAAVLSPQAGVEAVGAARLGVQVVQKVALQLLKLKRLHRLVAVWVWGARKGSRWHGASGYGRKEAQLRD